LTAALCGTEFWHSRFYIAAANRGNQLSGRGVTPLKGQKEAWERWPPGPMVIRLAEAHQSGHGRLPNYIFHFH
jgi:hypothetical protein